MDPQLLLPWVLAIAALLALMAVLGRRLLRRRAEHSTPLPTEWGLTARPVFSADERRVYRQLRDALPHHIVLSKLPLVRFCQPTDSEDTRYWFDLLGGIHVTFAVCSANGRVVAAIDLDTDRGNSRRVLQIKQSVMAACRIRYLRCPVDHLPSVAELQLLVPQSSAATRGPQPAPGASRVLDTPPAAGGSGRQPRNALWQDSGFFQDSFFAPAARTEGQGDTASADLIDTLPGRPDEGEDSRLTSGQAARH